MSLPFATFGLHPQILKALEVLNYTNSTPVQAACIPEILKDKDIIATAQTGTGKTAAFMLPILHKLALSTQKSNKPRVLILAPTRELAMQITKAADQYGKFFRGNGSSGFTVVSLLGGMPFYAQSKSLSRPVDIIVATPGRLIDHMTDRLDLSKIEILVLDEADRMLDIGFQEDIKHIAKAASLDSRQTLLFSATTDDKVAGIIKNLLKNPEHIDLSSKLIAPTHIKQSLYMSDSPQHKARLFQHFLANESIYKAIIFSATKINTDRLARQLEQEGYAVSCLHGGLKQNVRNRTIEQFHRKGQLLVATDVAARGINVADISHVINYDLPKFCEDYVHRIGRTGRAGKSGIAVSFGLPTDDRTIMRIERYIGQKFERAVIEGMEPSKQFRSEPLDSRGKKPSNPRFSKPGLAKQGFAKQGGFAKRESGNFVPRDAAPRARGQQVRGEGNYASRANKPSGFTPRTSEFAPRSSGGFTPRSSESTPRSSGFKPRTSEFAPRSSGGFTPRSSESTPRSSGFKPRSSGFTPRSSEFTPRTGSPSSYGNYRPRSAAATSGNRDPQRRGALPSGNQQAHPLGLKRKVKETVED